MTLRQLIIRHDAVILTSWDHTTLIASEIHNTNHSVAAIPGMFSKHKNPIKPVKAVELHPFREAPKKPGIQNIKVLQMVGDSFMRGKR